MATRPPRMISARRDPGGQTEVPGPGGFFFLICIFNRDAQRPSHQTPCTSPLYDEWCHFVSNFFSIFQVHRGRSLRFPIKASLTPAPLLGGSEIGPRGSRGAACVKITDPRGRTANAETLASVPDVLAESGPPAASVSACRRPLNGPTSGIRKAYGLKAAPTALAARVQRSVTHSPNPGNF